MLSSDRSPGSPSGRVLHLRNEACCRHALDRSFASCQVLAVQERAPSQDPKSRPGESCSSVTAGCPPSLHETAKGRQLGSVKTGTRREVDWSRQPPLGQPSCCPFHAAAGSTMVTAGPTQPDPHQSSYGDSNPPGRRLVLLSNIGLVRVLKGPGFLLADQCEALVASSMEGSSRGNSLRDQARRLRMEFWQGTSAAPPRSRRRCAKYTHPNAQEKPGW